MYESTYAPSLQSVRDDMAAVRSRILEGSMSADDGEAVAKAGHVEVKAAEVDLHARIFATKADRSAKAVEARLVDEKTRIASAAA